MSSKQNTLAIVFNGGTYGTYLEWLLLTLSTDVAVVEPFTSQGNTQGNSHNSLLGTHLTNMAGFKDYLTSDLTLPTVRFHPKTLQHESLVDNLEFVVSNCNHTILLYPSHSTQLLCYNNYYQKVWTNWWEQQFNNDIDVDKIYLNWPVSTDVPITEVPIWVQREFLSYYLMPAWHDQIDWFFPTKWQHDKCLILYVDELLFDLQGSVQRIQDFWGQPLVKDFTAIQHVHDNMLKLQLNIDQDYVCNAIVDSVSNCGPAWDWSDRYLPLASQSWVQWKLREQGLEMQCHGLDQFPNNTQSLLELLYNK